MLTENIRRASAARWGNPDCTTTLPDWSGGGSAFSMARPQLGSRGPERPRSSAESCSAASISRCSDTQAHA
eukprot:288272-Alexandrium_andersonii.AAC.1